MKYFLFLPVLLLLWSCQREPDDARLVDQLVVSTNFDPVADFSEYSTYAIPTDTIGFLSNTNPNDTLLIAAESSYPRPVLQAVKANMDALGFTRVDRNANPDIGVNVYVVTNIDLYQQVVYPNYYYSNYYGYNSYYYYPYVQTYAYNTGMLVLEIVDIKNKTANNKVKVIWYAYLGDLYSAIELIPQSVEGIDQAFVQSPYLAD